MRVLIALVLALTAVAGKVFTLFVYDYTSTVYFILIRRHSRYVV
jgi:hypothetical protein